MGCLAGPLVVCVAAFDSEQKKIEGVNDSKTMSLDAREGILDPIVSWARYLNFGYATEKEIDTFGLSRAWQIAAKAALQGAPSFNMLIVDGVRPVADYTGPQRAIPKADRDHWQVSAASIVAKVLRDRHMVTLSSHYPDYLWNKNMGYGTKEHVEALKTVGPSRFHRKSFTKNFISST